MFGFLQEYSVRSIIEGDIERVFMCALWGYILGRSFAVLRHLLRYIFAIGVCESWGMDTLIVIYVIGTLSLVVGSRPRRVCFLVGFNVADLHRDCFLVLGDDTGELTLNPRPLNHRT